MMPGMPLITKGIEGTPLTPGPPVDSDSAPRCPAKTAAKENETRHLQWWYPKRCELPGCSMKGAGLKTCSGCSMVVYCCTDHQRADWPAHKEDCATFRRLGLRATFYTDEEMLARFPLGPKGRGAGAAAGADARVPAGSACQLCLRASAGTRMARTACCGQVVCDNCGGYQLGSYSRDFCARSHERYTLCGYHGAEAACKKGSDWRRCACCTRADGGYYSDASDLLWRGLNPYNYCPLLERDVPRHALCERCAGCGRKFVSGIEGSCRRVGMPGLYCTDPGCTGLPAGGGGGFMMQLGQR